MYYIGIDLGGTNIAIGICDEKGKIIIKDSIPTIKERDISEIVDDMVALAEELVKRSKIDHTCIKGVGIGSPGMIDNTNGMVVYANNLGMDHYPLANEFKKRFSLDVPVNLENDANAAALGEYIYSGEDSQSFVLITLGTGVGGGIIIDGKIHRGFNGTGAEIGHQMLVYGGKPCGCGRLGCYEAYASVSALIEQTKESIVDHPWSQMTAWAKEKGTVNGRCAFECAAMGDETAIYVRDQYIEYVAAGICSLVTILQPKTIAIGGGISREGNILLEPIKSYLQENNFNKGVPVTDIRIAKLLGDAGIVGAAASAMKI